MLLGLIVFYCGILNGVESLLFGVTTVGLKIVVLFLNLWSIASSSEDLDEVETRAMFLIGCSSLKTFFIGVFYKAGCLLTDPPGKLY